MTLALSLLAIMALCHGVFIAWGKHSLSWKDLIFWYRISTRISLLVLIGLAVICFLILAVKPNGDPFGFPVTQNVLDFAKTSQGLIGTIVIGFAVTLAFAALDLFWMNRLQQVNPRPVVFWLVWFIITFAFGTLLPSYGERFLAYGLGDTVNPQRSSVQHEDKTVQPSIAPATTTASTEPASVGSVPPPKLVPVLLLLLIGSLYFLWTTSLLYRRITEVDRLVGRTAWRLAFKPNIGTANHPAQAVVIGPSHSGKTELVRSIPGVKHTVLGDTKPTHAPALAQLRATDNTGSYDISIVDTGGEFMGDQLDILRNVRTDCLIVVLCAAHLIVNNAKLAEVSNWSLEKVYDLVHPDHREGMTQTFFRALFYVTNHAGKVATEDQPINAKGDSASEAVSSVYTVLVVLKDRDRMGPGNAQFDAVSIPCLEMLGQSIYERFARRKPEEPKKDTKGNILQNVKRVKAAAVKVSLRIPPDDDDRSVLVGKRSNILTTNQQFKGWPYALSGVWGEE